TQNLNQKLEFIGYDCCLMQLQDLAEFNSPYFNYMVGSEETEAGDGWDYDNWLDNLYAGDDTETVLAEICDTFLAENGYSSDQTLSVLDLNKMDNYFNKFEAMSAAIKDKVNSNKSVFKQVINSSKKYEDFSRFGLFDGKDFLNKLASNNTFTSFASQINDELQKANDQLEELKKLQDRAEELQNKITALGAEERRMKKDLESVEKAKSDAERAFDANESEIKNQNRISVEAGEIIGKLHDELSVLLDALYQGWENDFDNTRQNLRADADTYAERSRNYDSGCNDLKNKSVAIKHLKDSRKSVIGLYPQWDVQVPPERFCGADVNSEWTKLYGNCNTAKQKIEEATKSIELYSKQLDEYYSESGKTEKMLFDIEAKCNELELARGFVKDIDAKYRSCKDAIGRAESMISEKMKEIGAESEQDIPQREILEETKQSLSDALQELAGKIGEINSKLKLNDDATQKMKDSEDILEKSKRIFEKWERVNKVFGGTRFRTLVQTYILRPLLNNANIYLTKITDRYTLTCSEDNEQLSILVLDRYNKNQVRSVTVLSGGERFMISLALSLALSSLNRPDMNVNI
ncbi:MAG: hypothetical protein II088_02025, partial [Bacteroidales bacterium]|nr:hypothetical protein [Bacteroidales bacterium]